MKTTFKSVLKTIGLMVLVVIITNCNKQQLVTEEKANITETVSIDLAKIKERGKLIASTSYNSVNYFMYKGAPMGYQFDMLRLLASELNVSLEIVVNNDNEDAFRKLNTGEYDLIANGLTVTNDRLKSVGFTQPLVKSRQVLVQRLPKKQKGIPKRELHENIITDAKQLAGKVVYVQQGTVFVDNLKNLSDSLDNPITIIELPEEQEDIIKLIANGEINYTVCDENIGLVNQTYYPNIDVSLPLSAKQNLAWAVRKNSPELLNVIDKWLTSKQSKYPRAILYKKYFNNKKSKRIVNSDYYTLSSGKISVFDDIIKIKSELIGWDWRLLASLIYQESRFNPEAESWMGAYGLMQLMPTTADMYNITEESTPEQHITAGVKYISWIDKRLKKAGIGDEERVKFVIAAYNVGLGHVKDARKLAVKYGKNPDIWENNVDFFVLNKSKPKYFKDPVVKHGYARGSETYKYVIEIIDRFEHYKNLAILD